MTFQPSKYQQAIYDFISSGQGSGIVEAVAGSGKTTTIVEALKLIPTTKSIAFLAFNRSIAEELKRRVPAHVQAMTLNGLGHRALMKRLGRFVKLDSKKTRGIMNNVLSFQDREDFHEEIGKLVALAKAHGIVPAGYSGAIGLMPDTPDTWAELIDRYDIEVHEHEQPYVIGLVRAVLQASLNERNVIDFDDQLYMTVVLSIPLQPFDWLLVDEAQDVAPIQRALLRKALRPGGRLLAVGDQAQAIYGFRGADSESLSNIAKDFGAVRLPLSISYRCPKGVVAYAQQVVSHIEASDTAPDGEVVCWPQYDGAMFTTDDLIICRNTAPIISMAYTLIAKRVPVKVLGREIGNGLISLIDRLKAKGIRGDHGLVEKLDKWRTAEIEKFLAKGQEEKIDAVDDKHASLMAFINESQSTTLPKLKAEIEALFTADGPALTLCTIHKAKGLEANRVFILNPDLMPSRWARKAWQQQQESNIMYVAYTRAKQTLVFINSGDIVTKPNLKEIAA